MIEFSRTRASAWPSGTSPPCKTSFTYAVDWETGDAAGSSSNIPESGSSL